MPDAAYKTAKTDNLKYIRKSIQKNSKVFFKFKIAQFDEIHFLVGKENLKQHKKFC